MRPILGLAILLLGGLLLMAGCAKLNPFRRADSSVAGAKGPCVGAPAPEIDAQDFDGRRIKLSDQRGKVVAVVFWATWCPPCRAMIPHERELVEHFRGKPFVLIGVNNDDNHDATRKMIAAEKMTWPICKTSGPRDPINQLWKVDALPRIYVIDVNGIIRYSGVRGPDLEHAIETLLAEAEKKR